MKTGWLNFGGNISSSIGFYTTGNGTHNAPERDVTTFQIAGRNGDFFVDNGRYKNIEVTYPCFTMKLSQNEQAIRNAFAATLNDYAKLQDSYDALHFRLARPTGGIEFEPVRGDAANFSLIFDCDPRRFLLSGDSFVTFSGTWSDSNPTGFASRPQIAVGDPQEGLEIEVTDGDGRVTTFTATDDYTGLVIIDCETQDIYDDSLGTNLNYLFTISGDFPQFKVANSIELSGNYSAASVRPRWWEL